MEYWRNPVLVAVRSLLFDSSPTARGIVKGSGRLPQERARHHTTPPLRSHHCRREIFGYIGFLGAREKSI